MKSLSNAQADLAAMMAAYAAQSAALTAAYEAECNAPPSAEQVANDQLRRDQVALEQAAKAAIASDNAAAIAAIALICPLTAEQVEALPHYKTELVDCQIPKLGVLLKRHFAYRNANSNRQSQIDWVAIVDSKQLTMANISHLI